MSSICPHRRAACATAEMGSYWSLVIGHWSFAPEGQEGVPHAIRYWASAVRQLGAERAAATGPAIGIIPVRYGSTRLPAKALADVGGKPLIQHVYDRAMQASRLSAVVVAYDDERIAQAVEAFRGRGVRTRSDHTSGTSRCAEVAAGLDAEIIVNIQGDEPLIHPETIDRVVAAFDDEPELPMATAMIPVRDPAQAADPHVVKVVVDRGGYALYFSRSLIPYYRHPGAAYNPHIYKHLGIYGYRRKFLLRYVTLSSTPLQQAEDLEQLRVLEHGFPIKVVTTPHDSIGVDTAEDLERVRRLLAGAA